MNNINEIKKTFRSFTPEEKTGLLAALYGKEAVEWYENRQPKGAKRIVDPTSGRWVSEFTANGQKYYIRTPEQGLSLLRYSKLKEFMSIVGFDATYTEQMAALNRIVQAANTLVTQKPKLNELFAEVKNMQESIKATNRNWDYSMISATLFIVKPDEDLTEWHELEQEKKVEDWNKAGLLPQDFFLLTLGWAYKLQEQSNELYKQARQQARKATSLVG